MSTTQAIQVLAKCVLLEQACSEQKETDNVSFGKRKARKHWSDYCNDISHEVAHVYLHGCTVLPSCTYYVYITYCQYGFTMDIQTTMAVYKTVYLSSVYLTSRT